jgi:dipeptidyl aminopeptidase/acylaminoacyl peptidase
MMTAKFRRIPPLTLFLLAISCFSYAQSTGPKAETIKFTNPALGFQAELEGQLQIPDKEGKRPLVVFIHGSGKGTREEYKNLFAMFLSKGYAVFGYDKRGVGGSGGSYNGVGPKNSPMMIPLLASDAYEAIEAVKKNPAIDSSKIILLGGSQAGWIIPVVASMNRSVSHYVILYGPTVSVGEEIFYSRLAESGDVSIEKAEAMLANFAEFRGFDPFPYISSLKQKGLWIFGGKDNSIPTARSIRLLESLSKETKSLNTIKLYPNAGHGLRNVETGQIEDFAPFIMSWLEKM